MQSSGCVFSGKTLHSPGARFLARNIFTCQVSKDNPERLSMDNVGWDMRL